MGFNSRLGKYRPARRPKLGPLLDNKDACIIAGPGGTNCPCCFSGSPGTTTRRKAVRIARRNAKRRAIMDGINEL